MPAILLITNDDLLAKAYQARLTKEGFEVARCATGNEGLELGRHTPPDLILLDVTLPGLNGLDVLKWRTDLPPLVRVPVLLLVERTLSPAVLEECLFWAGGKRRAGVIEKDRASLTQLVERVRAALRLPSHAAA